MGFSSCSEQFYRTENAPHFQESEQNAVTRNKKKSPIHIKKLRISLYPRKKNPIPIRAQAMKHNLELLKEWDRIQNKRSDQAQRDGCDMPDYQQLTDYQQLLIRSKMN